MKVWKRFTFEAAHSLPDWPQMHGHSYTAQVWFEGPANDGYVIRERELSDMVESVRTELDHKCLNELMNYPTCENIARWIADKMPDAIRVEVWRESVGFGAQWDLHE